MIVHFPTGDTHLWTLSKLTSYSMMRLSDVIKRWDDSITEEKGYKEFSIRWKSFILKERTAFTKCFLRII